MPEFSPNILVYIRTSTIILHIHISVLLIINSRSFGRLILQSFFYTEPEFNKFNNGLWMFRGTFLVRIIHSLNNILFRNWNLEGLIKNNCVWDFPEFLQCFNHLRTSLSNIKTLMTLKSVGVTVIIFVMDNFQCCFYESVISLFLFRNASFYFFYLIS